MSRSVQWWGAGEEKRHYHEERASVLLGSEVPPRVSAMALETLGGSPVALRVRVFVPVFPAWAATLVALSLPIAFGLLHARTRRDQALATAVCVAACSGVAAGMIATPEAALGSVLAGIVAGTAIGVPLAVGVAAASRVVARRSGAASGEGVRHEVKRGTRNSLRS